MGPQAVIPRLRLTEPQTRLTHTAKIQKVKIYRLRRKKPPELSSTRAADMPPVKTWQDED